MVENPTVEYELLDNHAGYISLSSFEEVSSEQFKSAVDDLASKGMDKLIIDLRNNGGGVVQAAKDIADYLLPDGKTIVSFKGKGIDDSVYTSDDGHEVDVPIILLVNGESASASEVLTGALKDNAWAEDLRKRNRSGHIQPAGRQRSEAHNGILLHPVRRVHPQTWH